MLLAMSTLVRTKLAWVDHSLRNSAHAEVMAVKELELGAANLTRPTSEELSFYCKKHEQAAVVVVELRPSAGPYLSSRFWYTPMPWRIGTRLLVRPGKPIMHDQSSCGRSRFFFTRLTTRRHQWLPLKNNRMTA